jgi:hypothetical protein
MSSTSFVCRLDALPTYEQERHHGVVNELFGSIEAIRELDDGYAFRLPPDPRFAQVASEFISRERLCCPFFKFEIDTTSQDTWLRLTGPQGVKPFIVEEFGLQKRVAQNARGLP